MMNDSADVMKSITITVQRNHTPLFRVPISDMIRMTTDSFGKQYDVILIGRTTAPQNSVGVTFSSGMYMTCFPIP